jgi:uncharacterized protein with PIN domain
VNLFLDTTGVVKLYHDEPGSEKLDRFIEDNAVDLRLSISDIGVVEFHSAVFRRIRTRELDAEKADAIRSHFMHDLKLFGRVQVGQECIDKAIEVFEEFGSMVSLRSLDALQIASAVILHRQSPIDFFISSDTNQLTVAHRFFPTLNPLEM